MSDHEQRAEDNKAFHRNLAEDCKWCNEPIIGAYEDVCNARVCPKCFNSVPDALWVYMELRGEYITALETQRDKYKDIANVYATIVAQFTMDNGELPGLTIENNHIIEKKF